MKKIFSAFIISLLFVSYISAQEAEVKEPTKWKFGLHFNTLSPKEKAFNGLTKGVVIHKVSKDHPAEAAGILVGDILTHVDKIEIIDQPHCVEVMKNVDTSLGKSTLKIIRNGVKIDVIVKFE
jgi:S1-C subfamily serine protease